ncbi:hypothetical protein, partial [Vibrio furnissii]|uniref:hypothetical protein n=1 Tax=Vibrio furnissii TaxID=29494 RepID=UPI003F6A123D
MSLVDLNPRALAVLSPQFREPLWVIWLQQDLLFVRLFLGGKLNLKVRLHNKAFKRDSYRVAFLVCGDCCGESGLRKVGLYGIRPLTRR